MGETGFDLHYIEAWDGMYAPIGVRWPEGEGPFPLVLLAYGNGGGGVPWIEDAMANRAFLIDELCAAGYAAAWARYRMEVDGAYARAEPFERWPGPGNERFNRSPQEYEDAIAIVEYVRQLDRVDADRVAWVGVSHGGEMLLKVASEYGGIAAGVACEPASHEFFGLDGPQIREIKAAADARGPVPVTDEVVADVRRRFPRELVDARLAGIDTPMLVMGRNQDDLNAVFRATYDELHQAGKDVEWTVYDDDLHGYIFPLRGEDGAYDVNDAKRAAVAEVIGYLDARLR